MVSILILCYGQITYTKQCLKSLFEFTSQVKTPFEAVVVDNGSVDGTREYLQGLESAGKIKAIYNQDNRGFPAANNQAAKVATGEYLCLLNNDTILTDGWLEKLLRCIKSDSQLAAVGPYTSFSSGYQQVHPQPNYRGEEELKKYAEKFNGEEKYVDFLVFFCVLIKRKIWDEMGGLDEDFGQGCFEDNLFNYRCLEKGYKLKVAGDCFIHHYAGITFNTKDPKKLKEYASLMARNQKIFLKKIERYETVSLCMIVSDQEKPETLKKCLDSIYEWVDEICIVFNYKWFKNIWKLKMFKQLVDSYRNIIIIPTKDKLLLESSNISGNDVLTGNEEELFFGYKFRTQIETQYFKFTNFSDMRNKSLAMATSRYVLWLDCDDKMISPASIRDLILKNPHIDVFKVKILSYTEIKTIETIIHNRLFRRVKDGKTPYWVNSCHEDISYSMNELKYTYAITDLTIKHFGYLNPKAWLAKNKRNLKLMLEDIAEIKNEIEKFPVVIEEIKEKREGRLSMIYYGLVNAYIILASVMKPKQKHDTLVQALNTTDECIKLLKNEDPLMAKMWMLRGTVCMDAGQELAAKQSYHKAYDEFKQPEAGINLSHIYLGEKKWNKVIEILDEINAKYKGAYPFGSLSHDPVQMHTLLLEKLGHAWANKGQECKNNPEAFDEYMKKAEGYYRECLNIRPKLEIANILIQMLRNSNRLDEATFLAIKTINKWRGYFMGWYYVGEYEQMNNRPVTAKLYYRECLKLKPGHKETLHNLGMIEMRGKRR